MGKKICLTILFFMFSSLAFAFDDESTHPLLTEKAVEHVVLLKNAIKDQLEIEEGIEAKLSIYSTRKSITAWLMEGSKKEDKPRCRAVNHFHDPTRPWSEAMLTDSNWYTDLRCALTPYHTKYSNLVWATGFIDQEQTPLEPPVNNDFDLKYGRNWSVARGLFYKSLTKPSNIERERYLAKTFLTLGHVLHLLQDMAVPAHTRNDFSQGHIQDIGCPGGGWWCKLDRVGNPFEGYVRDYFDKEILPAIADGISKGYTGEKTLTNFWDTDTVASPQIGFDIGLAEYSNSNFVSYSTIFKPESNTKHYFPYPNSESIANPAYPEMADYRLYQVLARDNQLDQVVYAAKNKHGEIIGKFLKPRYLPYQIVGFNQTAIYRLKYTLDDRCYLEYAKRLIPRAIGYSASLLDYFFRGRIDIQMPVVQLGPDSSITGLSFFMKNNTPPIDQGLPVEPFGPGTIELEYSYMMPGEEAPFYWTQGNIYSITGPENSFNFEYIPVNIFLLKSVPSDAYDFSFTLIFRGRMGAEEGAVAAQVYKFQDSRIAYFHQPGGQPYTSNVFTVSPSGSNTYQVTNAVAPDPWYFDPVWSRDGTMLAFEQESCTDPNRGPNDPCWGKYFSESIVVVDLLSDKQFPDNVIHEINYDGEPVASASFSPDGSKIVALMRNKPTYNYGSLVVFDLENGSQWIINTGDNSSGTWFDGSPPVWSPVGGKIAYYLDRQFNGTETKFEGDLFLINPDGTGKIRLTNDDFANTFPDWSPDGEFIIFSSNRDRGGASMDIWMMAKNGGNLMKILDCAPGTCFYPRFSPDGQKIAFTDYISIYTINSNGDSATLRKISQPGALIGGLNWSSSYLVKPTLELHATPQIITSGGSSTISWQSNGATEVHIDGLEGKYPPTGSVVVYPDITTKYTITAVSIAGAVKRMITITVQ
jgi:hypothetical protein